ncbi:MAG TPA: four-helix bundle copper-binding protein [Sporolactobacillaceae bacterium]|nr:four-helix bundle copper-binding protein [Sporolactobacillaceae bacterium]
MEEDRLRHLRDRVNTGDPLNTLTTNQLIRTLNDCHTHCEQLIIYLLDREDLNKRRRQLKLLRDCESLCAFTSDKLASASFLAPSLVNLVAFTCEHCAHECGQFQDPMSQRCSSICYSCAKVCTESSGSTL